MATTNPPLQMSPLGIQNGAIDQPQTNQQIAFPVRQLKILGGIQVGIGVLLGVLSIIAVILDAIAMHKDCNYDPYDRYNTNWYYRWNCWSIEERHHKQFAYDLTCFIFSGWFILTGFLPLCMSKKRESSWRGMRIGFMVCSIIGASAFVPVTFALGVAGSTERAYFDSKYIVLSAFIAVLSFAELVMAIVSASYCCCCTPWKNRDNQSVRVMYAVQPGTFINLPQTQIPTGSGQPNIITAVGQPVQYPQAQQYQIITTNLPLSQPIQAVNASGVVTAQQHQPQHIQQPTQQIQQQPPQVYSTDPPAYKE